MPREELFVVSKVAAEHKTYESAAKSIDGTLEKMGLDYLDMMIIHSPQPWVEVNQSEDHYVEGNRAACRLCFVQRRAGCDLVSYLTPRLFSHIGIKRPTWETDPLGNSFGAGGLFPIRIRLSLLLPNAVKVKNLCVHYTILCVQNYKLTFIGKQHPRHFYKGKE